MDQGSEPALTLFTLFMNVSSICGFLSGKQEEIWNTTVPNRTEVLLWYENNTYNYHSYFDVEYIHGFVWWGVCKQSRWHHSVTEPSEDSGYVLLWQRYDDNKMVAMRYYGNVSFCCWRCVYWACYRCILHLQQYSHRLNLLYFFFPPLKFLTKKSRCILWAGKYGISQ